MVGVDKQDIRGSTLYIARLCRSGRVSIAKPCHDCVDFLSMLDLGRIYYTNRDGWLEELVL
jgi:hypothetical protein